MKLAEALQERADLNRKIEQLRVRLRNNALVQEGEEPAEDPDTLLKELDASVTRLEALIVAINQANSVIEKDGRTLTEIIAEKDTLTLKIGAYRELIDAASIRTDRYTPTEIRILSSVDVRNLQKKSDAMSKRLRILDNILQETNWTSEIDFQ